MKDEANIVEEAALVTGYGQRQGEFFEGCERHGDVFVGVTCNVDP